MHSGVCNSNPPSPIPPMAAGTVAYLSPGMTALMAPKPYLCTAWQPPEYGNLSGYQLFPRWTGTVGASYAY